MQTERQLTFDFFGNEKDPEPVDTLRRTFFKFRGTTTKELLALKQEVCQMRAIIDSFSEKRAPNS